MSDTKDKNKELKKEIKHERWTNQVLSLDLENTMDAMPLKEAIGDIIEAGRDEDPLLTGGGSNPFKDLKNEEGEEKLTGMK